MANKNTPPIAKKIPKELKVHGDARQDPYYWLNDPENPEVISYLDQENKYTKEQLHLTETFQEDLFEEIKGRIKQEDQSVPYLRNNYWYLVEYLEGNEYPIYKRRKELLSAKDEILFDVNKMAEGHSYYSLKGVNISPNNQLAAFGLDDVSRRIYQIQFKDLKTGKLLPDKIENTTGGTVWANDNQSVFYTRKDENLRPYQIYKHLLGTPTEKDVLVYEETDETFACFVFKTKSREYIFIGSNSTLSNEYRFIPANQATAEWKLIQKRERGLEYSVEHYQNHFYTITNKDGATNFKLMKMPINQTEQVHWEEVIPHREDVLLEDIEIYQDYLIIEERKQGLVQLVVSNWEQTESYRLPFKEKTYSTGIGFNPDFDSHVLRYSYASMTTPWSTLEYNLQTKETTILKEQEVMGGKFDKDNYLTDRLWITARDGKKIPVSLVRHKDTKPCKDTPLLLYGYGSYGAIIDASFSSARLSLLDRGFIYAIAHIRGSEYLGRPWYEEGKLLKKKNTFFDFIDVAKYFVAENYTSSEHLYAMGGSAGGLLMGAVMNYEPQLFNGIVASVPFVDVVTTMLDESIPLTTGEFDEWGNPKEKEYYEYIKSYSPYDNVHAADYPHLLVTTGLHDSQVQYWEPAKWVARLRERKTNNNMLLLYTDMETGHGGASGRFESLKDVAMEYAFIFHLEGIAK